jgi:hypothetical protein
MAAEITSGYVAILDPSGEDIDIAAVARSLEFDPLREAVEVTCLADVVRQMAGGIYAPTIALTLKRLVNQQTWSTKLTTLIQGNAEVFLYVSRGGAISATNLAYRLTVIPHSQPHVFGVGALSESAISLSVNDIATSSDESDPTFGTPAGAYASILTTT